LNSNNVTRKTLRRIYGQCSKIFPDISSYYDPLQVVIKNFELNCIFSSTLILFASIYCKKGFPQCKENGYVHFPNFWLFFIQNAISSGAKCNLFPFSISSIDNKPKHVIPKYYMFLTKYFQVFYCFWYCISWYYLVFPEIYR
jgi:hypothetical protein